MERRRQLVGDETSLVRLAVALGSLLLAAGLALPPTVSAAASIPAPVARQARPDGTVSPDGLTATDGQRSLRVDQAVELSPAGQSVAVSGRGYDVDKGIYLALCLVTPPDTAPTPCGGGIDQEGDSGASAWISSNPPSYGRGLAVPYGPDGTFSVSVTVSPILAGGFDCRQVQCAVVSRNDHVRSADRSQDLLVPVRFAAEGTPPPEPSSTSTTLAPPPPASTTAPPPAPEVTLSTDGTTATAAGRTVTVSEVDDLDPAGTSVTVTGEGFDEGKGILVSLCRVAEAPTAAPGPCLAGSSPGASRWVSSSPPDYAADVVLPYEAGGRFAVELDVAPVIDGETDCRRVDCAVVVRRDDVDPDDRTLDVAVPVRFGAERVEPAPSAAAEPEEAAAPAASGAGEAGGGGGSSSALWAVIAVVVVAGAGAGSVLVARSRRRAPGRPAVGGPGAAP